MTSEERKKVSGHDRSLWKELRDEELLTLSISKDPDAFSLIVDRYRDAFLRKAKTILKDEADSEDAVQEAFVKLYVKGKSFRPMPGAMFNSWAYRVLINTCLTAYRKNSTKKNSLDIDEMAEYLPDSGSLEVAESKLSYDAFLSVASRLPEQFSSLLKKMVLGGRAPDDLAREEGVSVNAIRTRLHRARKAFAKVRVETEKV